MNSRRPVEPEVQKKAFWYTEYTRVSTKRVFENERQISKALWLYFIGLSVYQDVPVW